MAIKPISINKFDGGLNLTQSDAIKDNQFITLNNFYYNKDGILETRRGYTTFGDELAVPITSYFFFQNDGTLAKTAVCNAGTKFYHLDNRTLSRQEAKTGLTEFETNSSKSTRRTRWDYAVYKNIIYMGNGIDSYSYYSGYTSAYLTGGVSATSVVATWNAVIDGEFAITIDGDSYNITGIDFTNAISMTGVANIIQSAIRTETGGTETVVRSTDHFIITSGRDNPLSAITVTSTVSGGTGTDISGLGGTNFMDCDTGNGVVTNAVNSYTQEVAQPLIRYISYLGDRIFGAGDDSNPTTLYYTDAAPANAGTINTNVLVVGGDEYGQINGLAELGQVILAFKNEKIYSVDVTNSVALPIDAQSGGYCNRSIRGVGNSMVYYTDKGLETLKQRSGVSGSSGLEANPLSQDVNNLLNNISEFQYNSGAGYYNRATRNYYFSFDTNNDNIPDTTLVYSAIAKAWSKYNYPNIYDYGRYVNADQEYLNLFASFGQMYEMESGLTDNGVDIEYELETKRYDFDQPGLNKTFDYIDVIGWKNIGSEIEVNVKVEGELISQGFITDLNINIDDSVTKMVGTKILGEQPITGEEQEEGIVLYQYAIRIPCYGTGNDVSINMNSTGGVWQLTKMRVSVEQEEIEIFNYENIL